MIPSHSALRRRVARSRGIGVLAGLQLFTLPAQGQVESAPDLSHPGVWVDGSLDGGGERLVDYDAATSTFHIGDQLGVYSSDGGTLFYSFLYFGLNYSQIASLEAAGGTERTLARVTGGEESVIAGTIVSPTDLFLMNPAGITFLSGGVLDVAGSFHATTGDYLYFEESGEVFSASALHAPPLMVSAPPSHFGFASHAPAPVKLAVTDNALLDFRPGGVLSLIGGNVELTNDGELTRTAFQEAGMTLQLAGAAAPMKIPVDLASMDADSLPQGMGSVKLTGVSVHVSGSVEEEAAGRIIIRGEHFFLENGSALYANHSATTDAEGGIDIAVSGESLLRGVDLRGAVSRIEAVASPGSGRGADVAIRARTIKLHDEAIVNVRAIREGSAGDIWLEATELIEVSRGGKIISEAQPYGGDLGDGTGSGGAIRLTAPTVAVSDAGRVLSIASGAGDGGVVDIRADTLSLSRNGIIRAFTGPSPLPNANAAGGVGNGGDVTIEANFVSIDGSSTSERTGISTRTYVEGAGGNLIVSASVDEPWSAGLVEVDLSNGGQMFASTEGQGDAGNLEIHDASTVRLVGDDGLAGVSRRPSGLTSRAREDATGSGGRINVVTEVLEVLDGAQVAVSTLGRGRAGSIDIDASERITLRGASGSEPSQISAAAVGSMGVLFEETGDAGKVVLETNFFEVLDGGRVTTTRNGRIDPADLDDAGLLMVDAQDVLISGADSGLFTEAATPRGGTVRSGGRLSIDATGNITLSNSAVISAESPEGGGDAGTVYIHAGSSLVITDSDVFTKARFAEGGDIIIEASETIELVSASVKTQVDTGRGNAGEITVRGSEVPGSPVGAITLNNGKILSTANEGNGGDISIVARGYLPSGDSVVDASSDDSIDGKIVVRAPANDLTSEVAALPVELLDTAALVASACGPGAVQGASFQVQRRLAPPLPPDVSAAWRPAAGTSPCLGEETLQ